LSRPQSAALPTALAGLAALAISQGIGRFAMTPILPMMQQEGLSLAEGGWLAAANYLGYLAGALSTIWLNVPASFAIRAALLTIALSTLAMGLVDGFVIWLVLRALAGAASGWVLVLVSAWALERLAELQRPQLGGVLYAGVGTGVATAGITCLVVMQLGSTADTAWIALGAVALVTAGAIWAPLAFEKKARAEQGPAPRSGATGWLLILCYGAYGFGYIVPATFLPAMARQIVADPVAFGSAWPIFGAAAALSTLVASKLGASTNPRRAWIVSMLVMAVGVAAPLVVPGLAGILISAVLVGATFVTMTLAGMQEARRLYGAAARPVMAAMTSAFAVGQLTGPILIALLEKQSHGFTLVLLAATASLAAGALALASQRSE
jgi:predicted MFS family arabinose efflux permease